MDFILGTYQWKFANWISDVAELRQTNSWRETDQGWMLAQYRHFLKTINWNVPKHERKESFCKQNRNFLSVSRTSVSIMKRQIKHYWRHWPTRPMYMETPSDRGQTTKGKAIYHGWYWAGSWKFINDPKYVKPYLWRLGRRNIQKYERIEIMIFSIKKVKL